MQGKVQHVSLSCEAFCLPAKKHGAQARFKRRASIARLFVDIIIVSFFWNKRKQGNRCLSLFENKEAVCRR